MKCAMRDYKISKFLKEQENSRLLSNLLLKRTLSKISVLGDIFKNNIKWRK